jgi:hypothetical protein
MGAFWEPCDRICVYLQILDDSTDKVTRDLVDDKVAEWRERGVNAYAMRRTNRSGYKAGALKDVRNPHLPVSSLHGRERVSCQSVIYERGTTLFYWFSSSRVPACKTDQLTHMYGVWRRAGLLHSFLGLLAWVRSGNFLVCRLLSVLLGLNEAYVWQGLEQLSDYDYVAIFDADFKPEPDFLVRPGT